ncbi:hypothetical protein Stok01_01965 [Sulfurisphaera tokodaii]
MDIVLILGKLQFSIKPLTDSEGFNKPVYISIFLEVV